jgi:CcmD family protein
MKNLHYLFIAYTLVWAGAMIYLLRLSSLRRDLERRLARVEELAGEERASA